MIDERDNLLSALAYIDCSALDRAEWLNVGFALHAEGLGVSDWDTWSQSDPHRYKTGECARLWKDFDPSKGITGATIIAMAKERGWHSLSQEILEFDDEIEDDGEGDVDLKSTAPWQSSVELIRYLETLFKPNEYVAYTASADNVFYDEECGKWKPKKGVFTHTAGELIEGLKKYPNDIGAVIGDCEPEAGAWIRYNPFDGKGVKNENVAAYRYALVECDSMPIEEQEAKYRQLNLPIACMVYSGGKSIHAIVKIFAKSAQEYRERVTYLYDYLTKHSVVVDTQNINASRLSRMPGVSRNGVPQRLLAVNIGARSWEDWYDCIEDEDLELPPIECATDWKEEDIVLEPELISGLLRRGHTASLNGGSKAGKSFAAIELGVAVASGGEWFGFKCEKGRILYIDAELAKMSSKKRINDAFKIVGAEADRGNFDTWNLRGVDVGISHLAKRIVRECAGRNYALIIIDPVYRFFEGDENSAKDTTEFFRKILFIAEQTGASVLFTHHHTKGNQALKDSIDRGSGSGVFGRAPDLVMDLCELELSPEYLKIHEDDLGSKAFRMTYNAREFPAQRDNVDLWFRSDPPRHERDKDGVLSEFNLKGHTSNNLYQSGKRQKQLTVDDLNTAIDVIAGGGGATAILAPLKDVANYFEVTEVTVRRFVDKNPDYFYIDHGVIYKQTGKKK